ncbi:archease [Halopenitus persicus]|uniref:SHS2 domain-containing protein n=1 Tax=Halopenitus persicus TaxID=1048396 RepID=A0A1H3DKZ1_9EURY|nr:archease [Halopenitus persicus]QHS16289.1 archease [haloarchaeon 3A1-DGR]SDX67061.1 SHS2 domain-containing protein [Halopenitus persicus]
MTYRLRDHTADVAVEATADSLAAVFADVAAGLTAAMCEDPPAGGDRFTMEIAAESGEAALFDYLDRLIYERDVRGVLPVDHDCRVRPAATDDRGDDPGHDDTWVVEASARGVPLREVTARDVKAVTYSEMVLEQRGGEWYAYVVFDV